MPVLLPLSPRVPLAALASPGSPWGGRRVPGCSARWLYHACPTPPRRAGLGKDTPSLRRRDRQPISQKFSMFPSKKFLIIYNIA